MSPAPAHAFGDGPGGRGRAVDPDVDLSVPADRAEARGARRPRVLAAVALGGALGGLARYGLTRLWPPGGGFPWAMLLVNLAGCALIGVLMAVLDARGAPALTRPLLGVGLLGGFTSFSAYAWDGLTLVADGAVGAAAAYLGGTLLGALGAVWAGAAATRRALAAGRAPGTGRSPGARR
ncbi:CrcB family protein [Streptomyces sp. TRM70308]|uniref:FluC/FEX family fluoride channel n=1 Tax=Streptomyces sp. TRM70308 TaxID=3131932 RepID=UPI003D03E008